MRIRTKRASSKNQQVETKRRKQRKQLEEVERDIESLEQLIDTYDKQFAQLDPADYGTAQTLKRDYDGLKKDLHALYAEWERLLSF